MDHWLDKGLKHLQLGETLIASGVEGLFRGWKASAEVIGKLRTGADRWHQAIREIRAQVNLADILRERTSH
jgi:hypothetical protein